MVRRCFGGLFDWNSQTKYEIVRDGLSHTIAVGERHSREHAPTWVGSIHGTVLPSWRVVGWAGARPNDTLDDPWEIALFSSEHGRITNFVFADGSTHTIRDGIDPETFRALATYDSQDWGNFDQF